MVPRYEKYFQSQSNHILAIINNPKTGAILYFISQINSSIVETCCFVLELYLIPHCSHHLRYSQIAPSHPLNVLNQIFSVEGSYSWDSLSHSCSRIAKSPINQSQHLIIQTTLQSTNLAIHNIMHLPNLHLQLHMQNNIHLILYFLGPHMAQ